jgi:hypothetical protein
MLMLGQEVGIKMVATSEVDLLLETLMKAETAEAEVEEAEVMVAAEEVDPIHQVAEAALSATRKVTWPEIAPTLAQVAQEEEAPAAEVEEEPAISATKRVTWLETAPMPMTMEVVEAEEEEEVVQVDQTEVPLPASSAKRKVTCLESAPTMVEIREDTRDSVEMMEDPTEEVERTTMEEEELLLLQTIMHGEHHQVEMHSVVTTMLEEEAMLGVTTLLQMKFPLGVILLSLREVPALNRALTLGALKIMETLQAVIANGLAMPRATPKEAAGDFTCE